MSLVAKCLCQIFEFPEIPRKIFWKFAHALALGHAIKRLFSVAEVWVLYNNYTGSKCHHFQRAKNIFREWAGVNMLTRDVTLYTRTIYLLSGNERKGKERNEAGMNEEELSWCYPLTESKWDVQCSKFDFIILGFIHSRHVNRHRIHNNQWLFSLFHGFSCFWGFLSLLS